MSEFDKEAEREKLREKYAREEQRRETTQRMSELLLRGATMTNQHCDACGDPLFRYEGQVFCATCQAAGGEAGSDEGATDAAQEGGQPTQGGDQPAQDTGATAHDTPQRAQDAPEAGDGTAPADTGGQGSQPADGTQVADGAGGARDPSEAGGPGGPTRREAPWPDQPPADADLPAVRESDRSAPEQLEAVVAHLARRAANTEDPTQAREWLAAAREASEALAALRGSR